MYLIAGLEGWVGTAAWTTIQRHKTAVQLMLSAGLQSKISAGFLLHRPGHNASKCKFLLYQLV